MKDPYEVCLEYNFRIMVKSVTTSNHKVMTLSCCQQRHTFSQKKQRHT